MMWWMQAGHEMAQTVRDPRVVYFASGTNNPGEIDGLSACGVHIGACVPDLVRGASGTAALDALEAAALDGAQIFLDSGAFAEVDRQLNVVRPISDEEWRRRLGIYAELAARIGPALHFVCPDRVGDQEHTLWLLAQYAPAIRAIAETGARPLVAHQRGELSLVRFGELARLALGGLDIVPAFPMCRGATSLEALSEFCSAVQPSQVHLLGIGVRGGGFEAVLSTIRAASSKTRVLCDSVLLSSIASRSGGPGGGPRMLTMAQDATLEEALQARYAEGVDGAGDYTDAIGDAGVWLSAAAARRVCDAGDVTEREERRAALQDMSKWLGDETVWANPMVEMALELEWQRHYQRVSTRWRKRQAVIELLGEPAPGSQGAGSGAMLGMRMHQQT